MAGPLQDPPPKYPVHKIDLETLCISMSLGIIAVVGLLAGYEHVTTAAVSAIAGISYAKARSE